MSHDSSEYRFARQVALYRDQYRCTWAGCTATRRLETHHVWQSQHGGPDDARNLRTYCQYHHDLADRLAELSAKARGQAATSAIRRQLEQLAAQNPVSEQLAAHRARMAALSARAQAREQQLPRPPAALPMPTAPPAVPPASRLTVRPPSLLNPPATLLEALEALHRRRR